ncbi:uncharacterized protein YMR196W isoform X2 [Aplysia californica]|nr:uncharacterized protein YMR196W isoform X2 [Aplysia californica]
MMASSSGLGKRPSASKDVDAGASSSQKRSRFADAVLAHGEKEQGAKEYTSDPLFWGPYLAERQWGTVREDYSLGGNCWDYLSHAESAKQAYHWGEDGLLGISDKFGLLCASVALWNHKDPILKERLFGLTGNEGNHGEDVKELYYYLDNTPKHTYMKACYRYPQTEFPYGPLLHHGRSPRESELEILDTGVFDAHSYWDVNIEYAKPATHSVICRINIFNHSAESAKLDIIPQFYFRNTWSWPRTGHNHPAPVFQAVGDDSVDAVYDMGIFRINFHHSKNVTFKSLLFTDNNSVHNEFASSQRGTEEPQGGDVTTDRKKSKTETLGKKDAFHKFIIKGDKSGLRADGTGTKFCAWMSVEMEGNTQTSVYWQIFPADHVVEKVISKLDNIIKSQKSKAEDFYAKVIPKMAKAEEKNICRQAIAGLLWSKQYYMYNMDMKNKEMHQMYQKEYLKSALGQKRLQWNHLHCHDILLMPDKWEFPWFAAWDLAFHCAQFSRLDMSFAKDQILLLLSDRYMHANGQIPGCEFDLGDPNPPITAWAVWKMYKQDGEKDLSFLKTCFNRLIFSFQWWTRLDPTSSYLYGNGFMGLDNISLFDRSKLPDDVTSLKQADCTGWMGLFCMNMLQIALELCRKDSSYTDMAIKFLKHFLNIAKAINRSVDDGGLWMEEDKFFYDVLHYQDPHCAAVRVRSWSGIVPLLACTSINLKHSPLVKSFLLKCDRGFSPFVCKLGENEFFLTLVSYTKLKVILKIVFSENEFLSPFGIRSLSKIYQSKPYHFDIGGKTMSIKYTPGESDSKLFGGNSNWRGPIWLCMNYMFVECLEKYSDLDRVFTLPLSVQYPTGTASKLTFLAIAQDLCQRVLSIFLPNVWGARPVHGTHSKYAKDSDWESQILFYEYFHADTGRGCGASHQTGWSALVLEFIHKLYRGQVKNS